jgi:uncharacterized membrane protein
MVCTSILSGFVGSLTAEETAKARAESRLLTTPDGLSWADPVRITNNNVDNAYPTLAVDSGANAHILYYSNGQDFKYQKWQRPGKQVVKETQIVSAAMTFQHAGYGSPNAQPTERIGIDGEENIHVVWATGQWGSNQYQKFSNNGKPISQVIDPSPTAQTPQLPYLGVGKNNYAYIGTEQEGGGENGELTRIDKKFNTQMVNVRTYTEGVSLVVDKWNDDNVQFFTRTWSGTGIFHSKFTADLQMTVSPHEIYAGLIAGTGWDSPVPLASTTPNGHVHILLYSAVANPKTLYYGETDKNGNPLNGAQAFTVTQDACDYGDIVGDGENNVYVIWGSCSDASVYYTKIIEGNEQSSLTKKAIKISAGLTGQSSWPQFGVDGDNGLHVVFINNGGGSTAVYYRYAYTFGVELGLEPSEQAKLMFIHPMEIKTANITVKNVGGQNDTMHLNISVNLMGHENQGWDSWLAENDIELTATESKKVEITVKGPDFGNVNDFIEVHINATSERNPDKNDSVHFRVFLMVDHNIRLDCLSNVAIAAAGQQSEYACQLHNLGDITEDVKVDIIDQPMDWLVIMKDNSFPGMKPKESKTIIVDVTPPKTALANEVGSVTLRAYLQNMPEVKSTATLHTIVAPYIFIKLKIDQSIRYVDPGNASMFTLTVINEGNQAGTVVIILEIVSGTGAWNVMLERTSVTVPNNGQEQVKMTVLAPENASAGTRLVVRVVASDESRTMSAEVTATTIVNQVHNLDVAIYPPEVQVKPGETANYELQVKNEGNGPETMKITPLLLKSLWSASYLQEGIPIEEIRLQPGEQKTYTVALKVPGSELADTYISYFQLKTENWNTTFQLNTRVLQIYAIQLTTDISKQTGTPGGTLAFMIVVKNNGNGKDIIALSLEDKPMNWGSNFKLDGKIIDSIALKPGEQAKPLLYLDVPATYTQDNTEFHMTVTGTSEGRIQDKVSVVVNLLLPNLKIMKVTYHPARFIDNKPVTIEVIIFNQGQVSCENVTIRFKDKTVAGEQVIERFPANQNKTAVFTWMPKTGQHRLEYIVDPDSQIIESNKEDNKMVDKVTVSSGGGLIPGFDALLFIVAMVPVVLVLLRRKQ